MIYINYFMIVIILSLNLLGCSSSKEVNFNKLPNEIYVTTKQKILNGHWKKAITQLERLNNSYLLSPPYYQQVQLNLIYTYYKNANFQLAKTIIDRFIYLNPVYCNIDYVLYMRGLVNIALDNENSKFQSFLGIDNHFDHNPNYAYDAFNDFSKIVLNYPKSQYINDANKYLIFLKNRLAKYEYSVAEYYAHRGAWIAVINRVEEILLKYPDTDMNNCVLNLMENAYRQIQLNTQANKIANIITNISKNNLRSKFFSESIY